MATPKQTAANRANSQKSTGPRTTAGKANSRYNALKHGIHAAHQIMFDETAEDLAELTSEYHEQFNPANAEERFLVDTLAHNEWRLRRMRRVEAELWELSVNIFLEENAEAPACSSGDAFSRGSSTFERLQRIVNSCQRAYRGAAKDLERLQSARPQGPAGSQPQAEPAAGPATASQPQQSPTTSANLASFRVNSHAPNSAAIPPETQPSDSDREDRTAVIAEG